MAAIRFLAGSLEICAALLMLRFGKINRALQINALLGLVGPVMMLTVASLGIIGLVGRINPFKTVYIILGVLLILLATR
ncbi:MAG: DUF2619 domain-containing protein [Firmicutes bacterium]|nr:DUF2619 domain-containing protein [Bacillota bacterium]